MIRLETLIELKCLNSSNSSRQYLGQQYPPPLLLVQPSAQLRLGTSRAIFLRDEGAHLSQPWLLHSCCLISISLSLYICVCIYIYICILYMCVYIYIYIYIYISRPRGDRKFLGCCFLGCLGGDFGESVLKERRSERARLD